MTIITCKATTIEGQIEKMFFNSKEDERIYRDAKEAEKLKMPALIAKAAEIEKEKGEHVACAYYERQVIRIEKETITETFISNGDPYCAGTCKVTIYIP